MRKFALLSAVGVLIASALTTQAIMGKYGSLDETVTTSGVTRVLPKSTKWTVLIWSPTSDVKIVLDGGDSDNASNDTLTAVANVPYERKLKFKTIELVPNATARVVFDWNED